MKIWKQEWTLESLNSFSKNTLVDHLGIEFIEIGEDYLIAKMPVDQRTVQPMRILHGGASVVLAETLGSSASVICLEDMTKKSIVGVEINANHLKSVKEGHYVTGKVTPIRIGRTMHIWNIEIRNDKDQLTCVSRLTIAVIDRK